MKRTQEEKDARKIPTPKGRHNHGKTNPFSGKNGGQRGRLSLAFDAMSNKSRNHYVGPGWGES